MLAFAKIGKKQLLNIIRIKDNYKIVSEQNLVISPDPQKCTECDVYRNLDLFQKAGLDDWYQTELQHCEHCSHCIRKTEKKVKYINERNQYGYQPALKANAIRLFLAYHFYPIDAQGIIKHANIYELASLLNCDIKTIYNNNRLLTKYGYICHGSADCDGDFVVMIKNYEDNFKPAKEGGRGYLNLSFESFRELLKLRKLNALRIYIRELAETEMPDFSANANSVCVTKKYREMLRALPSYCNRSIIQSAVHYASSVTKLFTVEMDQKKCRFIVNKDYDVRAAMEHSMELAESSVLKICTDLQNEMKQSIQDLVSYYYKHFEYPAGVVLPSPDKLQKNKKKGHTPIFVPSLNDMIDFRKIAVQYGIQPLQSALSYLFRAISIQGVVISNPGGYVRRILQSNLSFSNLL